MSGSDLILVRPLGFSIASRQVKRAGLDYWEDVNVQEIDDLMAHLESSTAPFHFFSSKAKQCYTEAPFCSDSQLIFGSETDGLAPCFLEKWPHLFYRIPMRKEARCLNLSCSVSIVLYEAWRQLGFSMPQPKH